MQDTTCAGRMWAYDDDGLLNVYGGIGLSFDYSGGGHNHMVRIANGMKLPLGREVVNARLNG